MIKKLTLSDLDPSYKDKIYAQKYGDKDQIDGVQMIPLKRHVSEDGDFSEIIRINEQRELQSIPGFKLVQVNRTQLQGNVIKAWHIHLAQNEIWYVNPEAALLVGLLDLRNDSPTKGKVMRFMAGVGKSQLLFIPQGVAHGSANLKHEPAIIWYFIDQHFDKNNPDELRLPWDTLGSDFWKPVRD